MKTSSIWDSILTMSSRLLVDGLTTQLMFIAPQHIRDSKRVLGGGFEGSGVSGDPSRASVEYGEKAIELKIEAALRQIKELFNAG